MKIIRAKILGFCAGVRRAVLTADKALIENKMGQVYTLGPLIHNPVALKKLADRNLKILSENEIPLLKKEDTVIIRAHGIPPEVHHAIEEKGSTLINATCPLVTQSQNRAAQFAREGWIIFFAGDKNHGEVIGIEGYARQAAKEAGKELNFILIKDEEELQKQIQSLKEKAGGLKESSKVVLLSQTTFSISVFDRLTQCLNQELGFTQGMEKKCAELKVISSICPATHERQDSLVELCSQVEGVIVIGGRTSANTNRLFVTAEKLCKKALLIEKPEEIPEDFFSLETIGITAGASTPDDIIEAVEKKLTGD
ncbi:MAG: 4-hydroxy-3-methylbut-2-enyl diphosphate reductase [Treponema sp.]|nr:4-hydroxy-3-methylbut-2-enyl diphosphate reductase [Treponema sp.]